MLEGEIKIGEAFVWEPNKAHAREQVEVAEIRTNSDGEVWIKAKSEHGHFWNEEDRFREACERRS